MKKVISATLTVVLTMLMAINVFASSADDWRGKFISDNSGTFYDSFGTKCFLTKPSDMPDYIYAVYNDASMSSDLLLVLDGDANLLRKFLFLAIITIFNLPGSCCKDALTMRTNRKLKKRRGRFSALIRRKTENRPLLFCII